MEQTNLQKEPKLNPMPEARQVYRVEDTLLDALTVTLECYYQVHPNLTIMEILKAIEEIRFECTEAFINAHPDKAVMLGRIGK